MKTALTILSAAVVGTLLGTTGASALTAVASADLNLRAGPGPQYPIITAISANGAVEIHGCTASGNWCDLTWQGTRGWAYAPYLNAAAGQSLAIGAARIDVPTIEFQLEPYWSTYYQDRPFYQEREVYLSGSGGLAAGAATGAVAGAVIGGPIGAAIGGVAGGVIGVSATPPDTVRTYVTTYPADPVLLEGEVVVGATVPDAVVLRPIPQYQYTYAYVNGQPILVDPASRQIVYIYR